MGFEPAHIPCISISPAPPDEPLDEPYSPFSWATVSPIDEDSFRPQHLTPPPTESARFAKQLSPLRPSEATSTGTGLERDRFEALLKASRERNTGGKRTNDLRKEIALKAHKTKQVERRALFLSKVLAPPSPTATSLPKTPPESPAIFHYTLPSPGLVSPLALFESLNENPACGPITSSREPWVEQVDFRLPGELLKPKPSPRVSLGSSIPRGSKPAKPVPSLDQISARLSSHTHTRTPSSESEGARRARLPAFLSQPREPSPPAERPKVSIGVGRLQIPVRAPKPSKAEHLRILPPGSPCSPLTPNLQVTTLVVPRSSTISPTQLSESNLLALDSRSRRAQDMLSTLRRRTLPSERGHTGHDTEEMEDRKWKRHSAPADLPRRVRHAFDHPVLSIPGGF